MAALDHQRVAMAIELAAPLSSAQGGRLLLEATIAEHSRATGTINVERSVVERRCAELVIGPVPASAVRFDALVGALGAVDGSIAIPLAASVVAGVAHRLSVLASVKPSRAFRPVHGCLTPSAILVDTSGSVQVLGGGFFELTMLLVPQLERHEAALAPEVRRGEAPTARSDVYSLGVLCAAIFSGSTPHLPFDLADLLKGAPRGLLDVVARALAEEPEARWPSVNELAARLEALAEEEELSPFTAEDLGGIVAVSIGKGRLSRGALALGEPLDAPDGHDRDRAPRRSDAEALVLPLAAPSVPPPPLVPDPSVVGIDFLEAVTDDALSPPILEAAWAEPLGPTEDLSVLPPVDLVPPRAIPWKLWVASSVALFAAGALAWWGTFG